MTGITDQWPCAPDEGALGQPTHSIRNQAIQGINDVDFRINASDGEVEVVATRKLDLGLGTDRPCVQVFGGAKLNLSDIPVVGKVSQAASALKDLIATTGERLAGGTEQEAELRMDKIPLAAVMDAVTAYSQAKDETKRKKAMLADDPKLRQPPPERRQTNRSHQSRARGGREAKATGRT